MKTYKNLVVLGTSHLCLLTLLSCVPSVTQSKLGDHLEGDPYNASRYEKIDLVGLEQDQVLELVSLAKNGSGLAARRLCIYYRFSCPDRKKWLQFAELGFKNGSPTCTKYYAEDLMRTTKDFDHKQIMRMFNYATLWGLDCEDSIEELKRITQK